MPGQIGNRGGRGGSKKSPEMAKFYDELDAACLDAVAFLRTIVKEASKPERFGKPEWLREGVNAAGKLIAKAPERVENNLSGSLVITWDDDQAIRTKELATGSS